MQVLTLDQIHHVSGGEKTQFSNAFLSGMKGESPDLGLDMICGFGIGAVIGIFTCGSAGPGGALFGAVFFGSVGMLVSFAYSYNDYLLGRNYIQAQKLLNSN